MCAIDWKMLLEYLKVFLSWPPVALLIAMLFVSRFRTAIDDFLKRLVEGNIFGQKFTAVPPPQQKDNANPIEDPLALAAEASAQASTTGTLQTDEQLPPELTNEPFAREAINYARQHPVETVIEYRKLLFNYGAERLFARIYGTQISLLEFLKTKSGTPSSLAELMPFHDEHQRKAEDTSYQIRDYMNFLINWGVIAASGEENAHEYRIKDYGIEFLSYIKANYPLEWNKRAY
jgi:hypothetical protein